MRASVQCWRIAGGKYCRVSCSETERMAVCNVNAYAFKRFAWNWTWVSWILTVSSVLGRQVLPIVCVVLD